MYFDREDLLLYAVTDRSRAGGRSLSAQIEAALQGGVTMVQLREKELEEAAFLQEARAVLAICRRYQVPLILNDRVDAALEIGADGVHVGAEDEAVAKIRARAGSDFIIGATAKTVAQAKQAAADGADYLGVGAVFPSPTKQNAIRITTGQLREICTAVSIPAVAIGGITAENMAALQGCGMAGVAVVSALFGAADITAAARALKTQAKAVILP